MLYEKSELAMYICVEACVTGCMKEFRERIDSVTLIHQSAHVPYSNAPSSLVPLRARSCRLRD